MRIDRLLKLSNVAIFLLIFAVTIYIASQAVIVDSDSGFEFTNAQNIVLGGNPEPGPIVQQYSYATILLASGMDYVAILAVQCMLTALIVIVIFLLAREMGDKYTGLISLIAILPLYVAFFGPSTLKQYPLLLLFLLLSILYFYRFMRSGGKSRLVLSAVFMGAASITHLLALPFIGMFLLVFLISRLTRDNQIPLRDLMTFFGVLVIVLLPYLIWRLSLGDATVTSLLTYPSSWTTMKYGRLINTEFWGFAPPFTLQYYQDFMDLLVDYVFLPLLIPVVVLGILKCRCRAFIGSWFAVLVAPYLLGRGVISWFYVYPFFPLVVILTALGIREVTKWRIRRELIIVVLILFILFAGYGLSSNLVVYEQRFGRLLGSEYDALQIEEIVPVGANVLFRSRALSNHLPYRTIIAISDLSEEDATLYLNWESDSVVTSLFIKNNISYVILYEDVRYERDYQVWFEVLNGHKPRHYLLIEESEYFALRYEGTDYRLYEFLGG